MSESVSDALASLPEITTIVPERQYVKKAEYASEVRKFLECQGICCTRNSPKAVQLLSNLAHGELVFRKLTTRHILVPALPLAVYKA